MKTLQYPETPELDKMLAVKDKSQIIGEFINWLQESGYSICEYEEARDYSEPFPVHMTIEEWLAEYFELDLKKMEQERQSVLDYVREINNI